ncbi:carbohydrate ABC transporter permease [Micromonospora aurantiaca]|uniref:Carbohydrate ABC transporter permease n=1 Tax=Micromonospora aurantiaca (nom. illeg.) TaxID=47850 RepID=A0A1C6TG54_9ACTN|nr:MULTISPECIES: carbohydrate ABC transporter permease [Micromonospora]ADL49192.1 binding-protein-dependent transport systems inner membrane component [Micromonospora aurantiaca ATCC 27029]ADU08328.1 binding-protein-dependent transport systems inner membrane component [Micromonospora sp. L5]AXH89363.1 carbohydrate ABC transporter permease [Micromonospora aurantiaca]KAB1108387.1 carbohydrate ABC transporter permease [Micromonospora aurantiaca]MBC9003893.1 carbohydrate ABC transporter permease [
MTRLWSASRLTYLALTLSAILSIFPIYWMFVVASRTSDTMGQVPPPLTPGGNLGANIARLFDNTDAYFLTGLINSAIVATTVTISVVFFSTLAGFAFAKLRFRGRNALLLVIVATMMVPTQLGVIPLYLLMTKLNWNDRLPAVIVPALVTGFGVFMMRQYAGQAVSTELIEAARMDGCNTARIYWNVVLPALRPAAAVLGLLTFMTTWNDFLWPYAVLNDPENPTVQLSLRALSDGYYQDMSQVFTGTAIATLPLLLVFVVFGRQIIGGIMEGAVKA